ncbi:MAG TPA: type III pantothenate kinase [Pirellulales bacterium]|jgi:type III pantothenate kinase|nr:type III pantothenate kinase [Pirellulales bacterium]
MPSLIAVDIGNSRIKLGLFAALAGASQTTHKGLPTPLRAHTMPTDDWNPQSLQQWLNDVPTGTPWWIASVNRPAAAKLTGWIQNRWPVRMLTNTDLPISAAVEHPERVGVDRLAGAVAINQLREPDRAAITIGVGSAITVDLIAADGTFCGGAILPGIAMSARALDQFTDLLPLSPLKELSGAPSALGTSTLAAIHSGLFWGAVGAIRELITQLSQQVPRPAKPPQIFLTGGAAPSVAEQIDPAAEYVEHLALAGIALAKPDETHGK